MWVPRCIIAVISMLVLTATPAVVEGTCHCADVCPSYDDKFYDGVDDDDLDGRDDDLKENKRGHKCWKVGKHCIGDKFHDKYNPPSKCDGYCVCNTFGCNCDGCDRVPGGCAKTRTLQTHERTDEEEEDGCTDFRYIKSLSPEGKRDLLAEKYCSEDDKVAVQNIFEILRNEVLRKLDGSVLTCALFNEASYGDMSHLTLCEDKQQHVVVSLLTTSSSTGNTDGGHSFVLVVLGLLGAAMILMKVVQRRHRVLLRRNQYSNPDDEL